MTDYTDDLNGAIEDIAEAGRFVELVSYVSSGPSYDPIMVPVSVITSALQTNFNSNQVDGTTILATDKKFIFAGDVEPKIGMEIKDGLVKYEIKNVWQVKPGNLLILSKVQARL